MNSLLLKGLLSALMLSKAPVEPICVSIDTYTNDQDTIHLLGNVPLGSPKLLKHELADFIQVVKSKHDAYVIGQDLSHYDGHDRETMQYIDTNYHNDQEKRYGIIVDRWNKGHARPSEIVIDSTEIVIDSDTALRGLAALCDELAIPFFNAECRHEVLYDNKYNPHKISAGLILAHNTLDQLSYLKKFYNISWLFDLDSILTRPVDARLLRGLHDLTQPKSHTRGLLHTLYTALLDLMPQSKEKGSWSVKPKADNVQKNIFIFVDLKHIYRIIPTLEKHLHYTKKTVPDHQDYSIDRWDRDEEPYAYIRFDQEQAQKFIDKYQVSISDFFAEEK